MAEVTVVIPIRDRDPERVRNVINSLRSQGADYEYLVSDYGSAKEFMVPLQKVCQDLGVTYLRQETEGWPWNKSRAINAAVRTIQTPYVVTTDVDMLYVSDPIAYCLKHADPMTMYHLECWWLPESGDPGSASRGGHAHPGGFQFLDRRAFDRAGGYDEKIQYWGMEDWDWPWRLEKLGYQMVWLPEEYKFYHVWHPSVSSASDRPRSAFYETEKRVLSNTFQPQLSQSWGRLVTLVDRPILARLEDGATPPRELTVGADQLNGSFFQILKKELDAGGTFFRIHLGPRTVPAKVEGWRRGLLKKLLGKVPLKLGFKPSVSLNHNFEYFYSSLQLLLENGLVDYQIARDLQTVSLLFEKAT